MIQRTQINNISLDKIQDIFADQFGEELSRYMDHWSMWAKTGQTKNRSFYISINTEFHVDGILVSDEIEQHGIIFAKSSEVVQNLLHRASRDVHFTKLTGDDNSVRWAEGFSCD